MLILLFVLACQEPPVRADDLVLRIAKDGSVLANGRVVVKAESPDGVQFLETASKRPLERVIVRTKQAK